MTDEEKRGLEISGSGRVVIGRASLAMVAALSGLGGVGLGLSGVGTPPGDGSTVARLESCQRSEQRCSFQVADLEVFAEQALPVLETSKRGRSIAAQARLPKHLKPKATGNSE